MAGGWRGPGPGAGGWGGMAMLTKRPRRTHRLPAYLLLALVTLSLLLLASSHPVQGDLPTERDNPLDASRNVSWTMGNASGLSLQGIELGNANATLPWKAANISWVRPREFVGNGSTDANLTISSADITIRADVANHVPDGDFATVGPWTYESSGGNITATWDQATAMFRTKGSQRDSLDSNPGTWIGVNGLAWTNATAPHEGKGMLGLNFSLGSNRGAWAGVQRYSPINWSGSGRMAIWILPLNSSLPLTFNVTAYVGSTLHQTTARNLRAGWQELLVDLTQLGPSRDSLVSLTLRVNGANVSRGTVYFDDLRVGNPNGFDETARIRQSIVKANATSAALGSSTLRLNWSISSASGVIGAVGIVNVSGPSGSALKTFSALPSLGWHTLLLDFSSTSSLPGFYLVNVGMQVMAANTTVAYAEARVDDIAIFFPNRHNGTYLSQPISLGAASEFSQVRWDFYTVASTSIRAKIRTGNDSNPGPPAWSDWRSWAIPGTQPAGLRQGSFVQIQIDLSTTNASASPSLRQLVLEGRHRSIQPGTISGTFSIPLDVRPTFLYWRAFNASAKTPSGTSISYSVGNGSYWRPVTSGESLADIRWTTIRWSAILGTMNGLATPSLGRIELVYEYLGPPARVALTWPGSPSVSSSALTIASGTRMNFTATLKDAGSHTISSSSDLFNWQTNDGQGQLRDGWYTAGDAGDYFVTATYRGTTLSARVQVHVVAGTWIDSLFRFSPYLLAMVSLGTIGYLGYQSGIRRMFKVDDLFIIGKDGRLLMHNTRRMRADRDEDILSGMITAILSFLKDADPEENGELKRFEIGGKTTLLERGAHANLVAVYSGKVPRWAGKDLKRFMVNLEKNFGTSFASWSGDPADLQGLQELTSHFVSRFRYRPPRRVNGRAA